MGKLHQLKNTEKCGFLLDIVEAEREAQNKVTAKV